VQRGSGDLSGVRVGAVAGRRRCVGVPGVCGRGRRQPGGVVPEGEAGPAPGGRRDPGLSGQLRMLTAREITRATVSSEASDCSIISSFAHGVSGMVSVGLNAVALVNET